MVANRYRADLEAAGHGSGKHGFAFVPPAGLAFAPAAVAVLRSLDGVALPPSRELAQQLSSNGPRGHLDVANRTQVEGWAQDVAQPGASLSLLILDNDVLVARVLANRYRADLEADGIGDGRHGFHCDFPQALSSQERHVIRVCHEADGVDLERSPVVLEPAHCSEVAMRQGSAGSPSEPRALVIDDWLPRLGNDAGSTAILTHIRSLQRLGYRVTFVAALEFGGPATDRAALDAIGVICCCAPDYRSVEEVLQRQAGEFDVVYLHRVANAAKYSELVRHHSPKARLVYSVADLHHLRLAGQAAAEDRPELIGMARRLRLLEFAAAALADRVITHSAEEAKLLKTQVSAAKVHTVRWSAPANPTAVPFARRHGIAFIGYYDHVPNLDAARWLITEIIPLVRRRDPTIECRLVGSGLPDALRRCCGEDVVAVGRVEDLSEIFDRVRLTVAPLAYGAGIKGKIVDSLAAGVPCVCTPIAAEGMDLPSALHACIADGAEAIAAAIHHPHCDHEANDACRQASLQYIEAMFSEERLDATMRDVVGPNPTPLPVVMLEPRPKAATAA